MTNKIIPLKVNSNFFYERAVRCLDKMNYSGALKYFRRAIEHDPTNPLNHCNLAGVLSEMGDYKESNKVLFYVINHVDKRAYECYYYIANNYANMGDFSRSATYARKYLDIDMFGEFAEDAEELLEYFGENVTPGHTDLAKRLLEDGKFVEASEELAKTLKDNPDYHVARNNLALTYFYSGKTDLAIKESLKVLNAEPDNIHAHCNLAVFYYEQEQREKASKELEYLCKVVPLYDDHVYKLAMTLGMLGEDEQAYRHFRRLVRRDAVDDYQIFYMLGVAAANTGRLEIALRYWKKALKLDSKSEIPKFYIELAEQAIETNQPLQRIGYFYNLPFEEHLKKIELRLSKGINTDIFKDEVVKQSLYWALKHSDDKTKFNVIRLLSIVFDEDVKNIFQEFLVNPEESDELKKIILILFHQAQVQGPYRAILKKKRTELTEAQVGKMYITWRPEWIQVLELVIDKIGESEVDSTIYIADLESIWIDFLSNKGKDLAKRFNPNSWAAALEYAVYRIHQVKVTKKEIATKYQVSVATVSAKYKELLETCQRLR